ncbi:MAG: four helix bundle protein [Bacteroidetes bacterium]|nr:four helix bundle protein [Bacteroidota bacterium]
MRQDPLKDLKVRTKRFALSVIRSLWEVKKTTESDALKKQIIRSASSVGANYRSACRARSRADFISKIKIALEEADETQYWLELFFELRLIEEKVFTELHKEADELIAIFVASAKTAQQK